MTDLRKRQYIGALVAMVLVIVVAFFVFGDKHDMCPPRLVHIDSLMEKNPKAAYDSLLHIDSTHIYDGDKSMEMRMLMLKATAQNKLYMQMPTDSAFSEVVAYYDRNGSDNEKMQSRYLLGCIYRDMNDAPKAIECYKQALCYADTTDDNCNYNTLFRIYGQMAPLYVDNHLYTEALMAHQKASIYALKAGDIYQYIRGKELIGGDYYAMGDTLQAIAIAKSCIKLYEDNNMHEAAAAALPTIIYSFIVQEKYDSAKIYMHKYEGQGGLFSNDSIEHEREHYYFIKGLYNIGIENIDSAEYYFRKVIKYGYLYDGYRGLALVYKKTGEKDSLVKYTELAQQSLEEATENSQSNDVVKVNAEYNHKTKHNDILYVIVLCMLFIIIATFFIFVFVQKKVRRKFDSDTVLICNNTTKTPKASDEELNKINKDIDDWKEELSLMVHLTVEERDILKHFDELLIPQNVQQHPNQNDWSNIIILMKKYKPKTYDFLTTTMSLSAQELKVCILVVFGYTSGDIAILLQTTRQRVSNIKSTLGIKLFNTSGARNFTNRFSKSLIIK